MATVKAVNVTREKRRELLDDFFRLIVHLETKDEVAGFLVGLLTPSEVLMFARRIQIAKMLLDGDHTLDVIRRELGVGFRSIGFVEQWLKSGNEEEQVLKEKYIKMLSKGNSKTPYRLPASHLDRYPGHRLLKDLFADIFLQ